MTPTQRDETLTRCRAGLQRILGPALDAVIVYGSHARGEASNESDIDVLCVMAEPFDYGEVIARASELTAQLSLDHDVVLSRAFVTLADYESRQLPFLMNVRREGLAV